jgi:hypothetical protein
MDILIIVLSLVAACGLAYYTGYSIGHCNGYVQGYSDCASGRPGLTRRP